MSEKANGPYVREWHVGGGFIVGQLVDVEAFVHRGIERVPAFRGVIVTRTTGTGGVYFHVKDTATGMTWHRVAKEMRAIEVQQKSAA